ncbi:MAG: nitroreductase family deazaflavin-dependent oxidoreductase, partial [Deltaproteobacteria bacterium]|nr:nitroreductase family deazaflavin-dependent oxidoreductase [Deltaproteobacteria bacterium]
MFVSHYGRSSMKCSALVIALAIALLSTACGSFGPLGPISGGHLRGEVHAGPVTDWAFAQEIETVQLETNPESPHSVNTWIGIVEGHAYIPTSLILGPDDPREREWVANVVADPRVRVRIDGVVYELKVVRVEDASERE